MECKHIYGFDEGYGSSDDEDQEHEEPCLCYHKLPYMDVTFKYCPLCGEKLNENL